MLILLHFYISKTLSAGLLLAVPTIILLFLLKQKIRVFLSPVIITPHLYVALTHHHVSTSHHPCHYSVISCDDLAVHTLRQNMLKQCCLTHEITTDWWHIQSCQTLCLGAKPS